MSRPFMPVLFLAAFSASPAAAQSHFEFSTFTGAYLPTRALVADTAGGSAMVDRSSGVAFGGRLTFWASSRLGIEGSFGMATGHTSISSLTTAASLSFSSATYLADVRVRFQVNAPGAATGLQLSAGAAITRVGNAFFEVADRQDALHYEPTVGGVVGLSVSREIGSGVRLRIDMEDRIYTAKFTSSTGLNFQDETQHDILFAAGLGFQL